MGIGINAVNEAVQRNAGEYIRQTDAALDRQIEAAATLIRDGCAERPIVLLSGPSGSGKTTTARKIEAKLDRWGYETHTLSMDDYFHSMAAVPDADAGTLDLESPERVDAAFLTGQLEDILACRPTRIPRFDFETATRGDSGWTLTRKPREVIILEGIHAFNPEVIRIPDERTVRLYVSVRTPMDAPDGTALHPRSIRLLRRMLRDKLYRGRLMAETLRMFADVQRGEERFIAPFEHRATVMLDTLLPYEVGIYRNLLWDDLQTFADDPEVAELLPLLSAAVPLSPAAVPEDSLIREFIGPK